MSRKQILAPYRSPAASMAPRGGYSASRGTSAKPSAASADTSRRAMSSPGHTTRGFQRASDGGSCVIRTQSLPKQLCAGGGPHPGVLSLEFADELADRQWLNYRA